jgi:hypothetical protein
MKGFNYFTIKIPIFYTHNLSDHQCYPLYLGTQQGLVLKQFFPAMVNNLSAQAGLTSTTNND